MHINHNEPKSDINKKAMEHEPRSVEFNNNELLFGYEIGEIGVA